jgi:dihydrofolate reductase
MSKQPKLTLVVAVDSRGGIGVNNTLPWHLPEDLKHFKRTTTGHPIVMGRKTFESIGRPLPNRRNIVVTRNPAWRHEGVEAVGSLAEAAALADGAEAFVIGGAQIFVEALPLAHKMIVTEIGKAFDCDTFFPPYDAQQWKETAREEYHSAENGCNYAFVTYERR